LKRAKLAAECNRYTDNSFIHSFKWNILYSASSRNYSEALPIPARLKRATG